MVVDLNRYIENYPDYDECARVIGEPEFTVSINGVPLPPERLPERDAFMFYYKYAPGWVIVKGNNIAVWL